MSTTLKDYNSKDVRSTYRLHLSENNILRESNLLNEIKNEIKNIGLYPDPQCLDLKRALAGYHRVNSNNIFIGNGLDEVVFLLSLAKLEKGNTIITSESTFPGYELSALANRSGVIKVPIRNYRTQPNLYPKYMNHSTKIAYLCNPHNPCGTIQTRSAVEKLISDLSKESMLTVIDEAYIDFSDELRYSVMHLINVYPNLLVLRSFSKSHGLAGVRIGYAVASKAIIKDLDNISRALPFRVNRIAQLAARMCIEDSDYIRNSVSNARKRISLMYDYLVYLGLPVVESATNFLLIDISGLDSGFVEYLENNGISVRDCGCFGLPQHIRVSFSSDEDCNVFKHALNNILAMQSASDIDRKLDSNLNEV